MKKVIVTTSWDDGHKLDVKLAALLSKYGVRGTFYIPKNFFPDCLTVNEMAKISIDNEIGAHTLNHVELYNLTADMARLEISGSKKYLENIINKEVKMFCYPRGKYSNETVELVKEAGFFGARSTEKFCHYAPTDFYLFGVSLHMYPFPARKKDSDSLLWGSHLLEPLFTNYKKIKNLHLSFDSFLSFSKLAKNYFDYIIEKGQIFHLYGHSWEVERYGLWNELEDLLKYISGRKDVLYLNNSESLEYFSGQYFNY